MKWTLGRCHHPLQRGPRNIWERGKEGKKERAISTDFQTKKELLPTYLRLGVVARMDHPEYQAQYYLMPMHQSQCHSKYAKSIEPVCSEDIIAVSYSLLFCSCQARPQVK